jgi:rare lipoprotein A
MTRGITRKATVARLAAWLRYVVAAGGLIAFLSGCSTTGGSVRSHGASNWADIPDAVPKVEPKSELGNPKSYVVFGKRYHTLNSSEGYEAQGIASWYGPKFNRRRTSSGDKYDMYAMTAAHKTLPLPTYVRVTNLDNGRTAVVKVNDRGPFYADRLIDLSYAAARKLGMVAAGTAPVDIRAIDPAHPRPDGDFLVSRDHQPAQGGASRVGGPLTPAVVAAHSHGEAPGLPKRTAEGRHSAPLSVAQREDHSTYEKQVARLVSKSSPHVVPAGPRSELRIATSSDKSDARLGKASYRSESKVAHVRAKAATKVAATTTKPEPRLAAASRRGVLSASGQAVYLQVGAFGRRSNAEHLRERLLGHLTEHVLVSTTDKGNKPLYKVHIGPLYSRAKAERVSRKLLALGLTQPEVVAE